MSDDTKTVTTDASAGRVTRRSGPLREDRPLTSDESARLEELRAKKPNPDVLPEDVRTEDEEREFRSLNARDADARRAAEAQSSRPVRRPNPRDRLAELKAKGDLGEGEAIDLRRLEELAAAEDRVAALKKQDELTAEEEDELARLQRQVAEARAVGGYDPNG